MVYTHSPRVMPGLDPGIHLLPGSTWMAGTSPAMTAVSDTVLS